MDAAKSVTATFALNAFTVTPSAGPNGSINPSTPVLVNQGATTSFTVMPSAGYTAVVGGSCSGTLAGSTYTTSAITGNCTVDVTFTLVSYVVSPIAGANGSISPNVTQIVGHGATTIFAVTPDPGYTASVVGSCGGMLSGNSYATNPVTANCDVVASFSQDLALLAVQSRKTHGAAGTFDIPIDTAPTITGLVSVEPRGIGSGHQIVFQFNQPVTIAGSASVSLGTVASTVIQGNNVVVTVTGILDNRRATITLSGVNGSALNSPVSIGFLVGDVNATRSVNSSDISAVKARSGQTTVGTNFRFDVNATGAINASDISAVKARSGLTLPPS